MMPAQKMRHIGLKTQRHVVKGAPSIKFNTSTRHRGKLRLEDIIFPRTDGENRAQSRCKSRIPDFKSSVLWITLKLPQ